MVTEYGAAGVDLPTFVRQHAPMTAEKAARFAANLAEQLAEQHARAGPAVASTPAFEPG